MKKDILLAAKLGKMKQDYGLGRLPSTDLRDHDYLAKRLLPKRLAGIHERTWRTGPILDQGSTSQCVGYSMYQMLITGPVKNKPLRDAVGDAPSNWSPEYFYNEAQKVDEWPGEGYDGTSVRAAAKVGQRMGFFPNYFWAFNVSVAAQWLLTQGPMLLGTIWTYSMFDPDAKGYIKVDRENNMIAGGHAYLWHGVNLRSRNPDGTKGCAYITNSWGTGWGLKGKAKITLDDLEVLLHEDGEALCATEVQV